ncbi:hypothetical protein [Cupriavidus sp. 2MCAB6]|uniref:hypothetical protein n=1 Tax=Cupriavidus sp. 2MCAB6 TaxID=3232981 RepID=UPI003F8DB91E
MTDYDKFLPFRANSGKTLARHSERTFEDVSCERCQYQPCRDQGLEVPWLQGPVVVDTRGQRERIEQGNGIRVCIDAVGLGGVHQGVRVGRSAGPATVSQNNRFLLFWKGFHGHQAWRLADLMRYGYQPTPRGVPNLALMVIQCSLRRRITVVNGQVHGVQGKAGSSARLDDPVREVLTEDRVVERDATVFVGLD